MDRYQKTLDDVQGGAPQKPAKKKKRLPGRLGQLQTRFDRAIDRYVRQEIDNAEIMLVPKDLKTCDPSLLGEIRSGHFGLDGICQEVGEGHPNIFEHPDADDGFNRKLLSFGWLRDLRARGDVEARREAQELVFNWIDHYAARQEGVGYEPEIIAKRIRAFLANSSFILKAVGQKKAWKFANFIAGEIDRLNLKMMGTPEGLPRLHVLSALVMAGLCLSRQEKLLQNVEASLLLELDRQVLPDGGHCSRNPAALYELLFDIIPLRKCFKGRGRDVPVQLDRAILRMLPMIRFFRLGDSSLARFNGAKTTPTDALAVLLAYDERNRSFDAYARDSGYARLQEGGTTLLCDVGKPPSNYAVKDTHAGCLSFEMTIRHLAVIVNSGAFQGEDEKWQRYARSTLAHSSLSIDDHSSGGFDKKGHLSGPHIVKVERADLSELDACHHGYEKQFGLVHRRQLVLSNDGLRLSGIDHLSGSGPAEDRHEYAIRFHLHPLIDLTMDENNNIFLMLPDGEIWQFTANGAQVQLADSVYLAYRGGPKTAHQIVLGGTARAGANISWMFEQYCARPEPT